MKFLSLAAILGLSGITIVHAAEQAEEIVVTATRTDTSGVPIPAAISVIDRTEIEASGSSTLVDLLRARAGVHVSVFSADSTKTNFDMRGFGAASISNTLVLIDGRPLNNSSDISIDLSHVDLDNVERVEIIQGSAGTLYGNQAVGGLINIVTRRIPKRPEARLTAELASFGEQLVGVRAGQRFDNGLAFNLRGKYREADNYRDHNHTRIDTAGLRVEQNFQNGLVFVDHDYADENIQLPGALFKDELDMDRRQSHSTYTNDYSRTRSQATRAGTVLAISENWRFEGEMTERENDGAFVSSSRGFSGSRSTQRRRVATFNPRFQGSIGCGSRPCQFTLGSDYEDTNYRLLSSFGPQNVDQTITGYYAQAIVPFGGKWSATAGGRHAKVSNNIYNGQSYNFDDDLGVGSVGLSWQPAGGWRIFARADQNYRFAKVDEHTNVLYGQPVGLHNQTGISYETGFEFAKGKRLVRVLASELMLDDEIAFDANQVNINIPQTRRYGVIAEGAWPIARNWLISAGYTWTDGRITEGPNDGMRIPLVPRSQTRVALDWKFTPDWSVRTEAQRIGKQYNGADFTNTYPVLPAYAVANLGLRYLKNDLEWRLQINNLFDEKYSETGSLGYDGISPTQRDAYFPSPGRNLRLAVQYAWH